MFHDRALVIPRLQANFTLNSNASTNGPFEGDAGKKWEHYCSPSANDYEGEKVGVKDYKGRLQMLLARRYRGVIFKICYDAPKSEDGIFKAMLMIIPQNVTDLALKICEGRSSRVKKISEQSVAETAVHMLEADILEVTPTPSTFIPYPLPLSPFKPYPLIFYPPYPLTLDQTPTPSVQSSNLNQPHKYHSLTLYP
jgi:hypothetical protein